jgi:hypothetical protein
LGEEQRLRVFENRMWRRISGLKRVEMIGGWRKLHNEELLNLYFLLSITRTIKSRRMRCTLHVACRGRKELHVGFWWEARRKRPLCKPRHRWDDNTRDI